MAAVADQDGKEDLERVFKGVFFVSKWLGLFPFAIRDGDYRHSPLLYAVSIAVVGMWSTYVIMYVDFDPWAGDEHLLKKLSQFLPIFTLFAVFPCNMIWLTFNAHKLAYVLDTLKRLDLKPAKPANIHVYKKVFFYVLLGELFAELYYTQFHETHKSVGFIYMFMVLSTFLIADQFASVLAVLRRYYSHICEELDLGTAVDFTNAHDLLGKSCREVNDCYSPQLLLIMISVFVYIVSGLYTLIIKYMESKTADLTQIYYILMFVATIFHFLTACRLTTLQVSNKTSSSSHSLLQQLSSIQDQWPHLQSLGNLESHSRCYHLHLSKKFDNLLYRLIINDKSKSLMRNNRILLHFKAMKDLEFSAMEFFNFDYSLICSVVSTATTYIVILVQFSQ